MYNAGPGSITNTVYWYNGKDIFPIKHNAAKKSIQLPNELVNKLRYHKYVPAYCVCTDLTGVM